MDAAGGTHATSPTELRARLEAERRGGPFLVLRDADGAQRIVLLVTEAPRIAIGRRPQNDVPLTWDDEVSRLHAVLEYVGGEWTVSDDGLSSNGSYVNGRRIGGRRRLRDGDGLRFGRTVVEFRDPAAGRSRVTSAGDEPLAAVELTQAQRSVLVALCRPFAGADPFARPASNQAIAAELGYSVDGVKTHLRALARKLGVVASQHNDRRLELVERALRAGLVTPGELRDPSS